MVERKSSIDLDMNRVHEELEKLNIATDVINKLELQLDEARTAFREIQTTWTQKLDVLLKKYRGCIEKARPYYEARLKARTTQQEAQKAALRFERANSMHTIAKEQVALTQESLALQQGTGTIEPVCLEVLNHHIGRVNEAERERLTSKDEHQIIKEQCEVILQELGGLERDCKRSISKSRPYFEARVDFTKVLENQKALICRLEIEIKQKKKDYAASLKRLEEISNEIHETRLLGQRDPGVGSETPDPAVSDVEADRRAARAQAADRVAAGGALQAPVAPSDASRDRANSAPVTAYRKDSLSSGIILLAHHLDDNFLSEVKAKAYSLPAEDYDCHYRTLPAGVKPFPTPPVTPTDLSPSPTKGFQVRRASGSVGGSSASGSRKGSAHAIIRRRSSGSVHKGEQSHAPVSPVHSAASPLTSPPTSPAVPRGLLHMSAHESGSDSDASVHSHAIPADDDRIAAYLACHDDLMQDIDHKEEEESESELLSRSTTIAMSIKSRLDKLGRLVEKDLPTDRSSGSGEETAHT